MINFRACLDRKKIIFDSRVKARADKEIEISKNFLNNAEKSLEFVSPEMATLAIYNSMFHSLRCLLYLKGYEEKSHICLFVAVKELYKNNPDLLDSVNDAEPVKVRRNDFQYGGLSSSPEEAEYFIRVAKDLLKKVKEIHKSTK